MSLTNLIETHSRRAASVCVLPSSTSRTARSRNSTGCGFPISDPHIFLQDMESQDDRYGNPESDQARHALAEGLKPRLLASEDEGVNVVRALVGVHRLEVRHVPEDVVVLLDAVAAVHVARCPRDVERLAAVVALDERDEFGGGMAFVHHPARAERGL